MPRKRLVGKREIEPDSKYNDILIAKMINSIMRKGKKSTAEKIVYGAIDFMAKKGNTNGLNLLKQAVDNVKPVLEVKPRRVGGATYQVPVEVPPLRRTLLAIKWIVDSAKARNEKTMLEQLANELLDATKSAGGAVKKKEDTHKMAEANKAFVHFRW